MSLRGFVRVFDPLIPVYVDVSYDGGEFEDRFCWNGLENDPPLMRSFAIQLCQEWGIPSELHVSTIVEQISNQIERFMPCTDMTLPSVGVVIPIRLRVRVEKLLYEDRIEWDLAQESKTIEAFAEHVAGDHSLDSHFASEIAFRLRLKVFEAKEKLLLQNFDKKVLTALPLEGLFRPDNSHFEPSLIELDDEEIDRIKRNEKRKKRRRKRMVGVSGEIPTYVDPGHKIPMIPALLNTVVLPTQEEKEEKDKK